jgi:uracil-DNA glycosylase family 4
VTERIYDAERWRRKILLDNEIRACRRCVGMNETGVTQSAPGWGSLDSPVAIVGQSLCEQCMEPQEPFYEGSGDMLEASFKIAGCDKPDLFITNVVHCHPLGNRESLPHEILNCSAYLRRELDIVHPRLVVGLGGDAKRLLSFFYPTARTVVSPFLPPEKFRFRTVPCLYFAEHPSSVKRKHNKALETEWVDSLGEALKWAISKGSLRSQRLPDPEPTCGGMVWTPVATEGDS